MSNADADAPLKLYIGQTNYSSWSLRPWLALKLAGVSFETINVVVQGVGATTGVHKSYSPSGLVPILKVGDATIWDSLAIIEYAYDALGAKAIWPLDVAARAHARCISAEMHAGFSSVRSAMPMNIRYRGAGVPRSDAVAKDVARIAEIWSTCLAAYGGPFLFGAQPCAADAMYAPVVWRFYSYNVALPPAAAAYVATMLGNVHMRAWRDVALAEAASPALIIGHYDASAVELGGPVRAPGAGLYDADLEKAVTA